MTVKKILQKYKSINQSVKAGIWFTICNVLQRGIQFLITPIITRLLTTEEYGTYTLFTSWTNIFLIFASLNLSQGIYYNGLIKNENDEDKYTASLQGLSGVSTICVFFIVTITYSVTNKWIAIPYPYIILMFAVILTQPAFGFWSAQQRIKCKYLGVLIITLLIAILTPLTGIIILKVFHLGGYAIILGYSIINIAINSIFYIKNFILGRVFFSKNYWKQALTFSLPLIPHYLSLTILAQSNRIMVGMYMGKAAAGIYSLANQVALLMSILTTGINSALTPWMYKAIKHKEWKSIRQISNILILVFMGFSMLAILLAPEVLMFLGTEEYLDAKWIIPPIMVATFLTFIYCIFGTVLFYYEDKKKIAIASMSGALLNVILNTIFIPLFGLIAAGYTTLISYIVITTVYYFSMRKCCKKNLITEEIFDIKFIIILIGVFGIYSAIALMLYKITVIRYMMALIIMFLLILRRKEITNIIQKLRRDKIGES